MDFEQFRVHSRSVLNYIIQYMGTISERSSVTDVPKTHLESVIPKAAPNKGESLQKILDDVEKCIIPSLSCLRHHGFHAFGQCGPFYPSVLSEMLKIAFGCVGFNWNICPSGKELESVVLDWYGKMIGLPEDFLEQRSNGGCVIQGTINECIVTCMISARQDYFKQLSRKRFSLSKPFILASLVAYCTKEAKCKFQNAISICMVNLKILDTDGNFCLRADTLIKAIKEDRAIGLVPFFVNITLGNDIGTCDAMNEIGIICEEHGLWLNVDASYAGNALLCSDYRHYIKGIEYATSININPCELSLIHHDCVLLFVTDLTKISDFIVEDRTMYNCGSPEAFWCFHKNKSFLAFQLWVNLRCYGTDELENHIRKHFQEAELLKRYMAKDERFSVLNCKFGRVYFRLKGSNSVNKTLLRVINASNKLHLNSVVLEKIFIICYSVCLESVAEEHIKTIWNIIKEQADKVMKNYQ